MRKILITKTLFMKACKSGLIFTLIMTVMLMISCSNKSDNEKTAFLEDNAQYAAEQTLGMLKAVGEPNGKNYPRSTKNDSLRTTDMYDWTPGFFPGSLWYIFELTGDTIWRNNAEKWTHSLEPLKTFTANHDLGFMMYCSYGNAERLAPQAEYKDILIESAESLSTRYDDRVKAIKSWNGGRSWGDTTRWTYPVIIDNMMNLEMLFYASKVSGNKKYYDIAVTHANTTLKNHFREDFGSYHVVDYDSITGEVRAKVTAQGFSDNSTWSRGQAWAIYGYTMVYRETKDTTYLTAAKNMADYFIKKLPEDMVPLWDFNVGQDGYTPGERSYATGFQKKLRDASAGAIVCSALFELGDLANNKSYTETAIKMLKSLASPNYRAPIGQNGNFLIMHCVGSIPHKSEIDVPLTYADYYFLEALVRYKNLK